MSAYYQSMTDIVAALRGVADQIERAVQADPILPAQVAVEVVLHVVRGDEDNATRVATVDRLAGALGLPTETCLMSDGSVQHGVPVQYRITRQLEALVFAGLDATQRTAAAESSGVTT